MAQRDILALAKQGNAKAIAALINRSLHSQGITAKTELREGCLHVLLESAQVPNQKALVAFIRKGIIGLGAESIKTVKVYGCQLGTDSPVWKQKIELRIDSASSYAPTLPEQEALQLPLQNRLIKQLQKAVTTKQPASVRPAVITENPFLNLKARSLLLWVILAGTLISFLISLGIGLSESLTGLTLDKPFIVPISYILTFSSLCAWILLRFKALHINPRRIIGNLPSNYRWLPTVGLIVAILLFSIGSFYLSFYFLSFAFPSFVESIFKEKLFLSASQTSAPLLYNGLEFLTVVVVAPVTEEFLFRGILLHRWAAKWGIRPAIIISSLVFGFLHANFVGLSMFGVVMALLYIKTRTLLVPIICHALNNGSVVILEFLAIASNSAETTYTLEKFRSEWWMGALYLVLSAPWLIRFIYKNWSSRRSEVPYFANVSQ
jgi:uncharacterized protein